jgi:putative ABC transport system permease protein
MRDSDWTRYLRPRLARLDLGGAREAEIVEELSQHLEERYEELRRHGSDEADARRIAMDELVDPDTLVEDLQPLRQSRIADTHAPGTSTGSLFADLWSDLRHAARNLRRQPGFAAVAILTLALGIGANSAIFALADATLLRPLPLPASERLVMLSETAQTTASGRVSPLNLLDWSARSRTFEDMAGFIPNVGSMVMAGAGGGAENVPRQWVTAGIFDVLGIQPIVGRTFKPDDDTTAGDNALVVLSESFWRSRFHADPGIVGKALRLDGEMFSVVGVVPGPAQLIGRTSLWALTTIRDAPPEERGAHYFRVIGRLDADATLASAAADMRSVAERLSREYPATNEGRGVLLEPLHDAMIGSDLRRTALLFLGVVGLVLLICCANVANLLLARATVRSRELAIRAALGANRWRVVRQMLTESLLLAVLGCSLGLILGAVILHVAPALIPDGLLPGGVSLVFDLRLVGFCIGAALLVGVLFGLAPAWHATRQSPAQAIGTESRATTGRGGRLRGLLVIGEIATAVVLLFGAGLLLRTLLAMDSVDRGYRTDGALTMLVDPLGSQYPSADSLLRFFDDVEREISSIHDVRDVAWSSSLPLGEPAEVSFFDIVGAAPVRASERPVADYQVVSPSYLPTLDVPMVSGRGFDDGDRATSVPVCIVNETFVRTHLQGISPIGARVALRSSAAPDATVTVREIVGVARQVRTRATETEAAPRIYVPLAQDPNGDIYLVARSRSGNAEALTQPLRAAIARIDKEKLVGIRHVMTLQDVAWEATSPHRFRAILVVTFAMLALLLAMVGVFGILAWSVQQRIRDFGVRMALGATANDVLRLVVRSASGLIATGAVIGFVFAWFLGRSLATVLYGVAPFDPLTFAGVAIVLAIAAAASTLVPAWRAARVDPVIAMRGS